MKRLRSSFALLLALAMVFQPAVTAFAETGAEGGFLAATNEETPDAAKTAEAQIPVATPSGFDEFTEDADKAGLAAAGALSTASGSTSNYIIQLTRDNEDYFITDTVETGGDVVRTVGDIRDAVGLVGTVSTFSPSDTYKVEITDNTPYEKEDWVVAFHTANLEGSFCTLTMVIGEQNYEITAACRSSNFKWAIDSTNTLVINPTQYPDPSTAKGTWDSSSSEDAPWSSYAGTIGKVIIENTIQPVYMNGWFSGMTQLTTIEGADKLDTDGVVGMEELFKNCSSLTTLDLSDWYTSCVTDLTGMFEGCSSLQALYLNHLDTVSVSSMKNLFSGCGSLNSIDVSKFNTENVTDMEGMFRGCSSLKELDLSNFKTTGSQNTDSMFDGCTALKRIYASKSWKADADGADTFRDCAQLAGSKGTAYSATMTGGAYAKIDGGTADPGYFTDPNYLTFTAETANATVTFKYASGASVQYKMNGGTWRTCNAAGTTVTLDVKGSTVSFRGYNVTTDDTHHFSMTGKITATGSVTSLTDGKGCSESISLTAGCYSHMFSGCTALTTVPELPAMTLAANCYKNMFKDCTGLCIATKADDTHTSKWTIPATAGAENWNEGMFTGCDGVDFGSGSKVPALHTDYYQTGHLTIAASIGGYTGTYDKTGHTGSVSVTTPAAGATVKYKDTDGNYTLTEAPKFTDAGTHTVYYLVTATDYKVKTGSYSVSIGKKAIGISWSDTAFTYDGQSHVPTAEATGLLEGDACTLTVTGAQTASGTHTATVTNLSNSNYKLPANASQTFTITDLSVDVTFEPNGGSVDPTIKTVAWAKPYGALPTPTRDGFDFVKWSSSGAGSDTVTADTVVTSKTVHTLYAFWTTAVYTITWKDENGNLIDTTQVAHGSMPTHADPTKASTAEYTYTFAGWTPALTAATGAASYRAAFTPVRRNYTVTIVSEDTGKGTVSPDRVVVPYGTAISTNMNTLIVNGTTITATPQSGYSFSTWSGIPSGNMVTGDVTITATFSKNSSGGGGGGGGGSSSGGGGGGAAGPKTTATTATYSGFWYDAGGGVWRIRNKGVDVKSAWLCDDAIAANGKEVWYLMNTDGTMLVAGLVQDNTGNYYSLETTHNGYYGSLRYKNGTYDCNGQQVYLEFSQKHDGTFGAVINPAGLEALKRIYGVTRFGVDNNSCQYTATFQ